MGHIQLAAPVSHIWYFKGIPSRLGQVLDIAPRQLEGVLYFGLYIVTDPGEDCGELKKKQTLTEKEYQEYREKYGDSFKAGMGAEAIKELLLETDLEALSAELKEELADASGQKKAKIFKETRRRRISPPFGKSPRMDDNRRSSGYPSGYPPDGAA